MIKKLKFILTLFFSLLILVSCSSGINYIGEGKYWTGRYNVTINTKSNTQQGKYIFIYRGQSNFNNNIDDLIIENGNKTTKLSNFGLINGEMSIPVNCSGCALPKKEDPIKITIRWDNNEESFELLSK
ncbi:hypothetical protein [Paenibacillus bouchesdurhonensis]|uniref:hypothetical protein n=1 Tax=Paenibacillus bouchesdurhonensis TaxID=1870990 RepID=UPI000DA620D6|nr:hypothetical protein [Paenibacillus bouchesdurhonensis]